MGVWTQLHQTLQGHSVITSTWEVCFRVRIGYTASFSKAGGSKLSDSRVMLKTTPNFALFDPCEN